MTQLRRKGKVLKLYFRNRKGPNNPFCRPPLPDKEEQEMEKDNSLNSRRSYSRVQVSLPLEVSPVGKADLSTLRSRMVGSPHLLGATVLPELADRNLREWLSLLNTKLDLILRSQEKDCVDLGGMTKRTHSLSGGGLSFFSSESYRPGDILELRLLFESSPPQMGFFYGEVTNSPPGEDGFLISVKFICLDETLREEIIRYIFEREREILRAKRG